MALLVMAIVLMSTSGCYWWRSVKTDEVGAKVQSNRVEQCVPSGIYTNARLFSKLRTVSVATITFEVEDPEVATADNQLVGVRITIQARRKGDCDSTKAFLTNWTQLLNDAVLKDTIDATAREGIKNGTRGFTLTQLLNDRNGLSTAITEQLKLDAGKYATDIVNVTIENIALDPQYVKQLQETAQLKAQEDFQIRRQGLIEIQAETDLFERQQAQLVLAEQLLVEQAQTAVDVEIATREGKKTLARQEVYLQNEKAFELEKLRLLSDILGKGTTYFLSEGTDLTLFMDGLTGLSAPIIAEQTP